MIGALQRAHAEAHCKFSVCRAQAGNNIYRSDFTAGEPVKRGIKVHSGCIYRENGIDRRRSVDRYKRAFPYVIRFAPSLSGRIRRNHRNVPELHNQKERARIVLVVCYTMCDISNFLIDNLYFGNYRFSYDI